MALRFLRTVVPLVSTAVSLFFAPTAFSVSSAVEEHAALTRWWLEGGRVGGGGAAFDRPLPVGSLMKPFVAKAWAQDSSSAKGQSSVPADPSYGAPIDYAFGQNGENGGNITIICDELQLDGTLILNANGRNGYSGCPGQQGGGAGTGRQRAAAPDLRKESSGEFERIDAMLEVEDGVDSATSHLRKDEGGSKRDESFYSARSAVMGFT